MKLVTFQFHAERPRAGLVTRHGIVDLAEASYSLFPNAPSLPDNILQFLSMEGRGMEQAQRILCQIESLDIPPVEIYPLDHVRLRAPINKPGALLDFYTFEQHVKTCRTKRGLDMVPEWYQYPVYYNGNPRTLIGHEEVIFFPKGETMRDYELELAIVIGKKGKDISVAEADQYIAGYTILNDWSARSLQQKVMKVGLGPAKGKDFGSSIGPYLVTSDELPDPRNLTMVARVNGQEWSRGNSGSAHFTFSDMIAFASESMTLYPGDILASGTVGTGCGLELDRFLEPGDGVELEIDGLGILRNRVGTS